MRPPFMVLRSNFASNKVVKKPELFAELGWDDLIHKPEYNNTCAVRISLALVKSGVPIRGRFIIKNGVYKGRMIEPGQSRLAKMLAEPAYFGTPEKFARKDAISSIGSRRGVVVFWNIPNYMDGRGGHIDIVPGADSVCGSDCYWNAKEIWFWPLP